YGFTAGGPAFKNKLFGFGAMQLTRFYGNETATAVNLPDANGIALLNALATGGDATVATNAKLMLGYLSNGKYLDTFLPGSQATVYKSLGAPCATPAPTATCSAGISIGLFQRPPASELSPDTQWTYRIDFTPTAK